MKEVYDLKVEVTEVKGDIKVINQDLAHIKNNHLAHIEKDISGIKKIMWTVGLMIFAELIILLRQIFFG
jgi:hypothetical protein